MDTTLPPVDPATMVRAGSEPPRERIVRAVAGWIADRSLAPGTRLPPVRDAADHFHVDKGTMVRAYRLLVERGIVSSVGRNTRAALVVPGSAGQAALRRTLAVVTTIRSEDLVSRPDPGRSLALAQGILTAAHEAGWSVLFQHSEALSGDGPLPTAIVVSSLMPGIDALLNRMTAARVPVAVYGDVIGRADVDQVVSDHADGVARLVAHLAAAGRRRIRIHLPRQDLPWMRARLEGYRRGMAAAGLVAEPPLLAMAQPMGVVPDEEMPARLRVIAGGLAEHLTGDNAADAILGVSDGEAMQIAGAVGLFHRRVHADVAICGYDDYWAYSTDHTRLALPPPLLTVNKRNDLIGRALVELVAARVAGTLPASPQVRTVPSELVEVRPPA